MENLAFNFEPEVKTCFPKRPYLVSKRLQEKIDYVQGLVSDPELAEHVAREISGPNPNYIVRFETENPDWKRELNGAKQKIIDSAIADYAFAFVDVLKTTINNPKAQQWVTICSNGLYAAGYVAPDFLDYSEPKLFKPNKKEELVKKQKLVMFIFERLRNQVIDIAVGTETGQQQ